jgi:hypothetical protein
MHVGREIVLQSPTVTSVIPVLRDMVMVATISKPDLSQAHLWLGVHHVTIFLLLVVPQCASEELPGLTRFNQLL